MEDETLIKGTVTAAASATSVTLPSEGLTIVAVGVQDIDTDGYVSIPLDATRNALLPFRESAGQNEGGTASVAIGPSNNMWKVHFTTKGITLNFTTAGLTNGTILFHYGSPMPGSLPLAAFKAIAVSFTTGATLSFTFPSGNIRLTGITNISDNDEQTGLNVTDEFNTGTGTTIELTWGRAAPLEIYPIDVVAAQTLTVTQTYDGTNVGTGYCIIYYA